MISELGIRSNNARILCFVWGLIEGEKMTTAFPDPETLAALAPFM